MKYILLMQMRHSVFHYAEKIVRTVQLDYYFVCMLLCSSLVHLPSCSAKGNLDLGCKRQPFLAK